MWVIASNQFFVDIIEGLNRVHHVKEIASVPQSLRYAFFRGALDPVSHNGMDSWKVAEQYKKAGLTTITVVLLERKRHEVLDVFEKKQTNDLITKWMEKR